MHNDIISDLPTGFSEVYNMSDRLIISDTGFRALLPSYIKPMTDKYKQMCGCEVCILVTSLQNDLNSYRLTHLCRLQKNLIDIILKNEYRYQLY